MKNKVKEREPHNGFCTGSLKYEKGITLSHKDYAFELKKTPIFLNPIRI